MYDVRLVRLYDEMDKLIGFRGYDAPIVGYPLKAFRTGQGQGHKDIGIGYTKDDIVTYPVLDLHCDGSITIKMYAYERCGALPMRAIARMLGWADVAVFFVLCEGWHVAYDGLKAMRIYDGMVIMPASQMRDA